MLVALRDMRSRIRTKHSTLTSASHAMTRGEIRKCDDVLFLSWPCFVFHARGHVHSACHIGLRSQAGTRSRENGRDLLDARPGAD
jgi:hypothetical protein